MRAELASPVSEVAATLSLADGQRLGVAVFVAVGQSIEALLDEPRQFLPVIVGGSFRLVSRAQIAVVSVPIFCVGADPDAPLVKRPIIVGLAGGLTLRGTLAFLPAYRGDRVADHLNEDSDRFTLHSGDTIHVVMKAHVVWVEEAP